MRKTILVLSVLLFPIVASAQSYGPPPPPPDDAQGVDAAPPVSEPDAPPPAPPAYGSVEQQPAAAPAGQWVYTPQYGWVWMPYGQQYVDEGAYSARQYVYSVRFGWSWVAAPWLVRPGIDLWFGHLGPSRFGWYRPYGYRGDWRGGGYRRVVPIYRGRWRR